MSNTLTLLSESEISRIVKEAMEEVVASLKPSKQPPQDKIENEYLTTKQVKEKYELSPTTLSNLLQKRKLKRYKINTKNYYKNSEIIEILENSRKKYELKV